MSLMGLGRVETLAPGAACDVMGSQQASWPSWFQASRQLRAYRAG